jgi:hypothetical protein
MKLSIEDLMGLRSSYNEQTVYLDRRFPDKGNDACQTKGIA